MGSMAFLRFDTAVRSSEEFLTPTPPESLPCCGPFEDSHIDDRASVTARCPRAPCVHPRPRPPWRFLASLVLPDRAEVRRAEALWPPPRRRDALGSPANAGALGSPVPVPKHPYRARVDHRTDPRQPTPLVTRVMTRADRTSKLAQVRSSARACSPAICCCQKVTRASSRRGRSRSSVA